MNAVKFLVLAALIFALVPTCAQAQEDVTFLGLEARTIVKTACFGALGYTYSQNTKALPAGAKGGAIGGLKGLRKSEVTTPSCDWQDVEVDKTGWYLNNVCSVYYTVGDEEKVLSHGSSTTETLLDALQQVNREGGKIHNIEIKGHGEPSYQHMGGGTFIQVTGAGRVLLSRKDENAEAVDITPLLKGVCKSDVKIQLNGCKTGRGEDNIAKRLSEVLPGSTVAGGALYQASVPFTSNSFGTKNYYRHGQRVSKWWYVID